MGRTVVGLDLSLTRSGVVVLSESGELISSNGIGSAAPDGKTIVHRMQRYEEMLKRIMWIVRAADPIAIAIEAYTFRQNSPGSADRIEFGALVRYALWQMSNGRSIVEVSPATLKKWTTGSGKTPEGDPKTAMIVSLVKRFGVTLKSNDEYDAYALAQLARNIAGYSKPETKAQQESLDGLLNPKVKKLKKKKTGLA